jgi:hypothetical protein
LQKPFPTKIADLHCMNKKIVKISVILAARCPAKIAVFVDDYKKEILQYGLLLIFFFR